MTKNLAKGVRLLDEVEGASIAVEKDSHIKYCARMFLHKGDEVTYDAEIIASYREHLVVVTIDGVELVEHSLELGKRRVIAGVEKGLLGMRKGGYREILVAPHLAYREQGIPSRIPANALLRVKLWVRDVAPAG